MAMISAIPFHGRLGEMTSRLVEEEWGARLGDSPSEAFPGEYRLELAMIRGQLEEHTFPHRIGHFE